jgi:hypothetical protein
MDGLRMLVVEAEEDRVKGESRVVDELAHVIVETKTGKLRGEEVVRV